MKAIHKIIIGFFALLPLGASAQIVWHTPPATLTATPTYQNVPLAGIAGFFTDFTGANAVDTVPVGGRMAYRVDPPDVLPTSLNISAEYKWLFAPALPVLQLNATGTAATASTFTPTANWYKENEISAVMAATAFPTLPASATIRTNVRYATATSALCPGDETSDDVNNIVVIDLPEILWTAGGQVAVCVNEAFVIPLSTLRHFIAGSHPDPKLEIAFTITYWGKNFVNTGTPVEEEDWFLSGANINMTSNTLSFPGLTEYGLYEIKITNITDRISRKSLDPLTVAGSKLPPDVFTVVILPRPDAAPLQQLQHIRNNP